MAHDFRLFHDGTSWTLTWQDGDAAVRVPVDCDVEATGGSFSRGDCIGEIAPSLPPAVQPRFVALTRDMGYPVALDEINATLARLTE